VDGGGRFFHERVEFRLGQVFFRVRLAVECDLRARVDAAGRNMAPRHASRRAGVGDGLGQKGIASERADLVQLAGVHVWLAGVAGGVDDELRLFRAEKIQQQVKARVIQFAPRERNERPLPPFKVARKRLADVTGTAEEENHFSLLRRFASATTSLTR
jgi:hypothetical protein